MANKLMSSAAPSDNSEEKSTCEKDGKFVKKSYPRPWEVELTDEEIETLRKNLKEDERKYEAKGRRLAEGQSFVDLFNKNSREE
jgi:hypothetical protein